MVKLIDNIYNKEKAYQRENAEMEVKLKDVGCGILILPNMDGNWSFEAFVDPTLASLGIKFDSDNNEDMKQSAQGRAIIDQSEMGNMPAQQ